jgi:diadenosine tetraphosphate (Ap4A) HIT family hydrolase
MGDCPFCIRIVHSQVIFENELAVAIYDGYPVSPGHTLIVPRRHIADLLALTEEEQTAIWALVAPVRKNIERDHSPDGYNIGVNIGAAGGQTVPHAHLHVIPRYSGDVQDPRGGIRWIIPAKAAYWKTA